MSEVKRILQVLTTMNRAGAETMVMNCYRSIDRSKYQFDFLVHRPEKGDFEEEIIEMGGRIFRTIPIRPWSYVAYIKDLDKFFMAHAGEFVAVHAHMQENSCFALRIAEKYGIKHRVSTSHAANPHLDYKFIFRKLAMWYGHKSITDRLACGQAAGECLYGKDVPFTVMHNPIDVQKFVFNPEVRLLLRKEKGWGDKIVIGNVARFGYPKNHVFMIDVLQELLRINANVILVLVGMGPDMPMVKEKVKRLGLTDKVFFEGLQTNVSPYLQAMDLLIHPSLYEGLPISIIEAQTSGLKCILSDTIDHATDVTGNVRFLKLESGAKAWAETMMKEIPYERENMHNKLIVAGYDVHENIGKLLSFYGC